MKFPPSTRKHSSPVPAKVPEARSWDWNGQTRPFRETFHYTSSYRTFDPSRSVSSTAFRYIRWSFKVWRVISPRSFTVPRYIVFEPCWSLDSEPSECFRQEWQVVWTSHRTFQGVHAPSSSLYHRHLLPMMMKILHMDFLHSRWPSIPRYLSKQLHSQGLRRERSCRMSFLVTRHLLGLQRSRSEIRRMWPTVWRCSRLPICEATYLRSHMALFCS